MINFSVLDLKKLYCWKGRGHFEEKTFEVFLEKLMLFNETEKHTWINYIVSHEMFFLNWQPNKKIALTS